MAELDAVLEAMDSEARNSPFPNDAGRYAAEIRAALESDARHREELTKIGDTLQSAADRLADHIERGDKPPYEVAMACHEVRDCVAEWTELRKEARRA